MFKLFFYFLFLCICITSKAFETTTFLRGKIRPSDKYNLQLRSTNNPFNGQQRMETDSSGSFVFELHYDNSSTTDDNQFIIITASHALTNKQREWPPISLGSTFNSSLFYEFIFGASGSTDKCELKWKFTNLNVFRDPTVVVPNDDGKFMWILKNKATGQKIEEGEFQQLQQQNGSIGNDADSPQIVVALNCNDIQQMNWQLEIQLIPLNGECMICKGEFSSEPDEQPWQLTCNQNHLIHRGCILSNYQYSRDHRCPYCRRPYTLPDIRLRVVNKFIIENPIITDNSTTNSLTDIADEFHFEYALDCGKTMQQRLENWEKRTDRMDIGKAVPAQINQLRKKYSGLLNSEDTAPTLQEDLFIADMLKMQTVGAREIPRNKNSLRYFMPPTAEWKQQTIEMLNGSDFIKSSQVWYHSTSRIKKNRMIANNNTTSSLSSSPKKFFTDAIPLSLGEPPSSIAMQNNAYRTLSQALTDTADLASIVQTKIRQEIRTDLKDRNGLRYLDIFSDYGTIEQHIAATGNAVTELEIAIAAHLFNAHLFVRIKPSEQSGWLWLYFSPDCIFCEQDLSDHRPTIALQHERFGGFGALYQAILDIKVAKM